MRKAKHVQRARGQQNCIYIRGLVEAEVEVCVCCMSSKNDLYAKAVSGIMCERQYMVCFRFVWQDYL